MESRYIRPTLLGTLAGSLPFLFREGECTCLETDKSQASWNWLSTPGQEFCTRWSFSTEDTQGLNAAKLRRWATIFQQSQLLS